MPLPCGSPNISPSPLLLVLNTQQFDQRLAIFVHGIRGLQEQQSCIENNNPISLPKVTALTAVLLNLAKALTYFLHTASSLQPLPTSPGSGQGTELADSWLTAAVADLRVECHKYSWTVVQIMTAMERRVARIKRKRVILKAETWWSERGSPTYGSDTRVTDLSVEDWRMRTAAASPTSSTRTPTSVQSWWSHDSVISPTSSTSTLEDEESVTDEEYDGVWLFLGNATIGGGMIWEGWSPSASSASSEYGSHW